MTRFTHVFSALAVTGALTGATIAACGSHPGSPGELPPVAPRPDPGAPGLPGAKSRPNPDPTRVPANAGPALSPGPVASATRRSRVVAMPSPEFAPVVGEAAQDAGTSDGYAPPMPPLPDGGVPADSRLEPR